MRIKYLLICTAIILALCHAQASNANGLDRVVALVGDQSITESELNNRLNMIQQKLKQTRDDKLNQLNKNELAHDVLQRMITEQVQLQYAREQGIVIDELTLNRVISKTLSNNKITEADLREDLLKNNIDYNSFREDLRKELVLQAVYARVIEANVRVSENEISQFLSENNKIKETTEFLISHILIKLPLNTAETKAREAQLDKAQTIIMSISEGADFAKLAAKYSEAADAAHGGSLGWLSPEAIPPLFLEMLKGLKPGQTAPPKVTPTAIHIVQLTDQRKTMAPSFASEITQTRARHILVRTNALVNDEMAQKKLNDIRSKIINEGASFAEMAKEHSEDLASATKGGDLSWSVPGHFVTEFEETMNNLKKNEISRPFKTLFGWHLLQVLDRKTDQLPEDTLRQLARDNIKEKKANAVFQAWLDEQRDRFFIDIRL